MGVSQGFRNKKMIGDDAYYLQACEDYVLRDKSANIQTC